LGELNATPHEGRCGETIQLLGREPTPPTFPHTSHDIQTEYVRNISNSSRSGSDLMTVKMGSEDEILRGVEDPHN